MTRTLTPTTRYIPTGAEARPHPDGLGIVYCYTTRQGAPAAIAYGGKRTPPDWNYGFRTEAQREARIAAYFAGLTAHAARVADQKTERTQPHSIPVGAIVYNSWGYDQTNVNFYQVVKVSANYVWVRAIAGETTETGFMSGNTSPIPDRFLAESPMEQHRVTLWRGKPSISFEYGTGYIHEPGQRHYCSWYA